MGRLRSMHRRTVDGGRARSTDVMAHVHPCVIRTILVLVTGAHLRGLEHERFEASRSRRSRMSFLPTIGSSTALRYIRSSYCRYNPWRVGCPG